MRLWTIHPKYLDAKGLTAAWREALLAQKVLAGGTRGYTKHPQLLRFRAHPRPLHAVAAFLAGVAEEAQRRGYCFDVKKISGQQWKGQIDETSGQLAFEWKHLRKKMRARCSSALSRVAEGPHARGASFVSYCSGQGQGVGEHLRKAANRCRIFTNSLRDCSSDRAP